MKGLVLFLTKLSFLVDMFRWFSVLLVKHFLSSPQKLSVILSDVVNVMIMCSLTQFIFIHS